MCIVLQLAARLFCASQLRRSVSMTSAARTPGELAARLLPGMAPPTANLTSKQLQAYVEAAIARRAKLEAAMLEAKHVEAWLGRLLENVLTRELEAGFGDLGRAAKLPKSSPAVQQPQQQQQQQQQRQRQRQRQRPRLAEPVAAASSGGAVPAAVEPVADEEEEVQQEPRRTRLAWTTREDVFMPLECASCMCTLIAVSASKAFIIGSVCEM